MLNILYFRNCQEGTPARPLLCIKSETLMQYGLNMCLPLSVGDI